MNPNWIDFSLLKKDRYRKKLLQPLNAQPLAQRLSEYFSTHDRYNIYGMSLFLGMTVQRFTSQYLKNDDKTIRNMAEMAVNAITSHAMDNPEEYKRTLRYILARENTGKDFIELSDEVQDANKAQIIILPEKKNKGNNGING